MTVYDEDFYNHQVNGSVNAAKLIVPIIRELTEAEKVLDIGSGIGAWVNEWCSAGVDAYGCDGDYVDRSKLLCDPNRFAPADLSHPDGISNAFPQTKFDLVTSLEVAEHLEDNIAQGFVDALCSRADIVLFGAALPGQGGTHHVNEQFPSYWAQKYWKNRFVPFDIIRPLIYRGPAPFWYRQNTMLFAKEGPTFERLLERAINLGLVREALMRTTDSVHFTLYLEKLAKAQGGGK